MERQNARSHAGRYFIAIIAPAVMAVVMQLTWPFFEQSAGAPFLLAVMICAWFGGLGPGLLSVLISFLVADYFFIQPYFALWPPRHSDLVFLITHVTVGSFISVLSESMHRAKRHAESSLESIRQSEEQFRTMANSIPQLAWMAHADGFIFWYNRRWHEYTGTTPEQMEDWGWQDVHDPNVLPKVVEKWQSAIARGKPFNMEFPLRGADGQFRTFLTRVQPLKDSHGRVVQWFGTNTDVEELKRAEESLRESESKLSGIIESAMDAIITIDNEQRIVLFNTAAESMFLCPAEEALGQPIERFIPARFRSAHAEHVGKFGQTHVTMRSMGALGAIFGLRANGEEFPIEASISQIEATGQKFYTVILRDITERKRAEEALKEHARILDLAPVLIRDLSDRIIFWNSGAEQMYGWSSEEAVGKITYNLFQTEFSHPVEEIKAKFFTHGYWEGELIKTKRDGKRIVVMSHWVLHKDEHDEPKAILEINNDITERRQAEEEVRRLNEELEQRVQERTAQLQAANKELEAFSYSVSHDLRAPLRHINGFSQALLEDYSDKLDEEGRGYLQEVRGASQEMAQLIDDVLQLARVTRSEMRREAINLSELARSVIAELQRDVPERTVSVNIEDGLVTRGDKRLLRIVLVNLLGNAWKFTFKRKQPEIIFGQEQKNNETIYFVRDNGAGFDIAYADKLFGAFQRLHPASEFEGTGIGLATVQRIINRHGGRVWAEGVVDKGATFYFTLPDFKGERI
jgi:PAS domain S-box-containing protein